MPILTIHGLEFAIPTPYSMGHVCTAVEAEYLNRAFGDALRNNWAKRIASAQAADESARKLGMPFGAVDTVRAEFEKYASTYSLGTAKLRFGDPVDREATKIARHLAEEHINRERSAGREPPELDALVDRFLASPLVMKEARRRVELVRATAAQTLDLFDELPAHAPAKSSTAVLTHGSDDPEAA